MDEKNLLNQVVMLLKKTDGKKQNNSDISMDKEFIKIEKDIILEMLILIMADFGKFLSWYDENWKELEQQTNMGIYLKIKLTIKMNKTILKYINFSWESLRDFDKLRIRYIFNEEDIFKLEKKIITSFKKLLQWEYKINVYLFFYSDDQSVSKSDKKSMKKREIVIDTTNPLLIINGEPNKIIFKKTITLDVLKKILVAIIEYDHAIAPQLWLKMYIEYNNSIINVYDDRWMDIVFLDEVGLIDVLDAFQGIQYQLFR